MDIGIGRPGEDEEADGRAEAAKESGDQAVFLDPEAVFHDVGYDVEVKVGDVDCHADETGDQDAEEDDTDHAEGEAVHDGVDERECLEEGVVDPVHEGGVEVYERDGRVFDCYLDRLNESVDDHSTGFEAFLVNLALRLESVVAGQFPQAVGAAEEEVWR